METRPRRKGMTLALVLEMKEKLERQETIGVASKDYPENIVNMLNHEGIKFKVEEIKSTYLDPIWLSDGFDAYIAGFEEKTKPFSMFVFSSALKILP